MWRRRWGWQRVAKTLEAEGRKTKHGGKWAAATVRKLLNSAQVRGRVGYAGQGAKGEHRALVRGAA